MTFMQVLELGCGNSQLCEELYKDGVTEITCIDLSAVAVENMQKKLLSKGLTGMLIDILQNIHTSNLLVERPFTHPFCLCSKAMLASEFLIT